MHAYLVKRTRDNRKKLSTQRIWAGVKLCFWGILKKVVFQEQKLLKYSYMFKQKNNSTFESNLKLVSQKLILRD